MLILTEWKAEQSVITEPLPAKCTQKAFTCTAGQAINTEAYSQTLDDNNPVQCPSCYSAKSWKCNHLSRLADKCWQVVCEVNLRCVWVYHGDLGGGGVPDKTQLLYNPNRFFYLSNRLNMFNSDLCVFLLGACVSVILRMTCLLWKSLLVWETTEVLTDYLMYTQKELFEMNHMKEGTGHVYKIKYNYPST